MNPLFAALARLERRLDEAGIASVAIGGIAVGVWGRPRATADVDLKLRLRREDAPRLLEVLGTDYRLLHAEPLEALRRNGILFVRDEADVRIDLHLADTPFDGVSIDRGIDIELEGFGSVRVCSAEDLIIYKLISSRMQDQVDVQNVILRQGARLDDSYVIDWLRQFEAALDDSTLVSSYRSFRRLT